MRARRERPRQDRGAAEKRDELPPPHTDHGDVLPRAVSAPLAAPCSVCRTFSLPQKEPQSPWADLNFSESGWGQSIPSSPIALEINDSTSLFASTATNSPSGRKPWPR